MENKPKRARVILRLPYGALAQGIAQWLETESRG